MARKTKQQATLQHLRSLINQPDEQARYALGLLEREHGTQVVSEALAALTQSPVCEGRPLLLRLYDYYDEAGVKRDVGGDLRVAILGALLPVAERAVTTYEFLPPKREEAVSPIEAQRRATVVDDERDLFLDAESLEQLIKVAAMLDKRV